VTFPLYSTCHQQRGIEQHDTARIGADLGPEAQSRSRHVRAVLIVKPSCTASDRRDDGRAPRTTRRGQSRCRVPLVLEPGARQAVA